MSKPQYLEKGRVKIAVAEGDELHEDRNFAELLQEFTDTMNDIPVEHRDNAFIVFESDYDTAVVKAEVWYERDETEEERIARINADREFDALNRKAQEKRDRALYEELRKRFEPAGLDLTKP